MRVNILALGIFSLLCQLGYSQNALESKSTSTETAASASNTAQNTTEDTSKPKKPSYADAVNTIAENINKASEKSQALVGKHMSAVSKDPGSLITKDAMEKLVQSNSLSIQKPGTRSIMLEAQQGFNGISNYQPSSWKITETVSGPQTKASEPTSEKQNVITYPVGVGPVLFNGCTAGTNYSTTSPCHNSKLLDLQLSICFKMMDAANYIGVGFDGRGYYRAESRRGSLIQRACTRKVTFMGQDVPDTMNVFGIFETTAETKSFQSVDEYMSYIRDKAGLSEQKNLFTSEASKYSKANAFGANLGAIGSIIGGAIGAVAGGPVGAGLGAQLGGAIGGSIGGGSGSGSGSESATDKGQSSSKVSQTEQALQRQGESQNFFAIMYVNVVLYEITLDDVKPSDINLAAFRDYVNLPSSYFSLGADVKFQNFLLRWGTHFIRSGKFGGQLKITKTAKADKVQSAQEFASYAETEFQSMFATLQSKYSQESSSWSFLGFGGESQSASQNSKAKSESGYKGTMAAKNQQSQSFRQSEFTQTTVEAQGGTPEIAEALVDFYTPAFKQLFHTWIVSIKDYAKPFEFQLRPIDEFFNLNMDLMFPAGNIDFGCAGGGSNTKVDILVDPITKKRYYLDTLTSFDNKLKVEQKVRVDCKYSSLDDFKQEMDRRKVALERSVGIYMAEGPFPTSSLELPAGQPGCEEATLAQIRLYSTKTSTPLKYVELLKQPFVLAFNLPEAIPDIRVTPQAKYVVVYRLDLWFAVEPGQELMNLYDGCQIVNPKPTDTKICFRNIILTYKESSGIFSVDSADFALSKQRIPSLPYWLAGTNVARSKAMFGPSIGDSSEMQKMFFERPAVPCNVKWLNSQRLDPSKSESCIHFTAASEGDLFVIFASIPRDHSTWYYLQITAEGVRFYKAMSLAKRDEKKGMGLLGDKNLYMSFFVCVIQKDAIVTMQYGKADPDSEIGTVYSAYTFPPDSQFSRLSFYSFGSGDKPASLMDVRQTKQMPEVSCLGTDYIKKDGQCLLDCHAECNGCNLARDSKECQQCKNMRVEKTVGDRKVTECLALCPAGMYPSATQQGLCIPCTGGTFKAAAGNDKCNRCAMGTSSPDGATICAGCPAGTFSDSLGSSKCQQCPAGKFALLGATSCTDCPVGTFSDAGQAECNPCPYGQYGDVAGMAQCKPCSEGYFADTRGLTACKQCPAGSSNAGGSRTCENSCHVGEFSPSIGVACAKCPAGSYAESRGSTECSSCRVGYYQPNTGQSNCMIVPKGSFAVGTGATSIQSCPAGTFNNVEGQTSCTDCAPGTYAAYAGSVDCSRCPAGQYQPSGRQASCIQASSGYFVDVTGATSQSPCRAGYISAHGGATYCSQCPAGQYAHQGWAACQSCNQYQYAYPGSASCTNCPNNGIVRSDKITCYTPPPPPPQHSPGEHVGCFRDSWNRDLPHKAYSGGNSVDQCWTTCRNLGFRFAGVQWSRECFCGNSYGRYGGANNCNMRCSSNGGQMCGGDWANNIYRAIV